MLEQFDKVMMDGYRQDMMDVLSIYYEKALPIAEKKGWSESTLANRHLNYQDFISQMKSGRLSGRSMLSIKNKLLNFVETNQ